MSLTRRGKWLATATVVTLATIGVVGFFVVSGAAPTALTNALSKVGVRLPSPSEGLPAGLPSRP